MVGSVRCSIGGYSMGPQSREIGAWKSELGEGNMGTIKFVCVLGRPCHPVFWERESTQKEKNGEWARTEKKKAKGVRMYKRIEERMKKWGQAPRDRDRLPSVAFFCFTFFPSSSSSPFLIFISVCSGAWYFSFFLNLLWKTRGSTCI